MRPRFSGTLFWAAPKPGAPITRPLSVADKIAEIGGQSSGFNYLRLALATSVLICHSIAINGFAVGQPAYVLTQGYGRIFHDILMPMFFALGGYLVAGSLDRSRSLITFVGLRVLRIFPALWCDILISALIFGPLFSTLPLHSYFHDHLFLSYLGNLFGWVHYRLPGVFLGNYSDTVNGQLWSVPYELFCYTLLAFLGLVGLYRRRFLFLLSAIVVQVAIAFHYHAIHHEIVFRHILVPCFLAGGSIHLYRHQVRLSLPLFLLCVASTVIALAIDGELIVLLAGPITYMTIYLGLLNPSRNFLITSGDYSYGMYIYGLPLQQALWAGLPFARSEVGNLILALPLTFLLSFLSWHLVEKRALAHKKDLYNLARRLPLLRGLGSRAPKPVDMIPITDVDAV
jgi:peptidoglycan/LPS O-acetylase OafA/YrhL